MIAAAVLWVPKDCWRYSHLSKQVELVPFHQCAFALFVQRALPYSCVLIAADESLCSSKMIRY